MRTAVPNLLGTRDRFCGRRSFHVPGMGRWFPDDSREGHVLCTLFPLLLYQLHLRGSGIRLKRLGTPAVQEAGSLQSSSPQGWGRGWESRSKYTEKSTGRRWWWTPSSICASPSQGCRKFQRPRSRAPSGNGLTCRRTPTSLGFEFSESF